MKVAGQHTWDNGVVTNSATCESDGEKLYTCSVCSDTKTEGVPSLGHQFDTDGNFDGKDASGHWYNCNRNCGEKQILSHTVVIDTAVAATCTDTGLTEGSHCSDCNYVIVKQDVVPALNHDFTGEYSKDAENHWHVCANDNCNVTDTKVAHTFDTQNCEQDATCTVCQYVKVAGQHTWDNGVVTNPATCESDGVKLYTCSVCSDTKPEDIPSLGHDFTGAYSKDEDGHWHVCANDNCNITDTKVAHSFDSKSDTFCEICEYEGVLNVTMFIRLHTEEMGDVNDSLSIQGGKIQINVPGVGTSDPTTGKLPVPEMRKGWTYDGWSFIIEDANGNRVYPSDWNSDPYIFTEINSDLETILKTAVDNSHTICMVVSAKGIENSGFSVSLDTSSYDMAYTLNVPAGQEENMFYLNFVNFDRCVEYSCSVWKDEGYSGKVWPQLSDSGYYGYFEVLDSNGNVLAATGDFPGFSAWMNRGDLADVDNPVVTINYAKSSANTIVYEISGLASMMNYWVVDVDATGHGTVYSLGGAKNGKVILETSVNEPLSNSIKLYGIAAIEPSPFNYIMEIAKPITVSVPAYDAAGNLSKLISKAEDLGLTQYLDKTTLTPGCKITRLQAAMLLAAFINLNVPADASVANPPFSDCAGLTQVQQFIIAYLTKEGAMAGYDDGSFRPDNPLTNAAITKFIDSGLGYPVVPVTKSNNVSQNNPFYWSYTMLDNLGILDNVDINVSAAAVAEDVLTMFIDAKEWRNANPANPKYPVSNIKLINSPVAVKWTPPATTGIDFWYEVELTGNNGNNTLLGAGSSGILPLFGLPVGTYETIEVVTFAYNGRFCGSTLENGFDIQVTEAQKNGPDATVTVDSNGTLTISGLTPNAMWHIYMGEKPGDYWDGIGDVADSSGSWSGQIDSATADRMLNGGYYLLREFNSLNVVNDKTCSMEVVEHGGWTQYTSSGGSNTPGSSYQVSNIHFDDKCLTWTTPSVAQSATNVMYEVCFYSNGVAITGAATPNDRIATLSFTPGVYDKVVVRTYVNGEEKAIAEQAIGLTITQGSNAAAPSSVEFIEQPTSNNYLMNVTGLNANAFYLLRTTNFRGDGEIRDVMSDSNGQATTTLYNTRMVQTGYYEILELTGNTVSADGLTCNTGFVLRGTAQKCLPATNTVWFNENGEGFLHLYWDYEELADIDDFTAYRVELYEENRGWEEVEWLSLNSNFATMNSPSSQPGHYTEVKLIAVKENPDTGKIMREEMWFKANINLTITEAADAPSATVADAGNGEYTFSISNLRGQMNSSVELMNCLNKEGNGHRYGDSRPTYGYGQVVLTVDWPYVANGYYRLREYVDFTDAGTTASFTIREQDWTKCVDCGHSVTNNAPVSNIRLETSGLIKWDAPAVANNDYFYEIYLSKDDGQTWSKGIYCGDNRTELLTVYMEEGTYNAIQIKTFLPEGCCDREVGMVLDNDFSLTVIETTAVSAATVTFSPVNGQDDTYEMKIQGMAPDTECDIGLAENDNGENGWGFGGHSDSNGNDTHTVSVPGLKDLLEDGYYRVTEFTCSTSNNGKTGTMTRTVLGSWIKTTVSVPSYSDTAWFEVKGDGALYFCWDMTPMANADDYADGYSLYLNDGTNWERVDGAGKYNSFWNVTSPGINPGTYTGIKLVGRDSNGDETKTWFEKSCSLTIADGAASSAQVTFTDNGKGSYDVEVSNMSTATDVAEFIVSHREGLGDIDYEYCSLGGYTSTLFEDFEISHPNGYYRVREYQNLSAGNLTASFTISESAWTKMNINSGSSGTTVNAPKGIVSMEQNGFSIKIGMAVPDDMSNIDYFSLSFYDAKQKDASKMTGITCSKSHPYFYVGRDKFDPTYTYDTVEITAHALNGYTDAVWTDVISVAQDDQSLNLTCTYDANNQPNPLLTIGFDKAAYGFYRTSIYNNGQVIANDNSYGDTSMDGLTLYHSCNAEEQDAINAGTASVKVSGWYVSQLKKENEVWTIVMSTYAGETVAKS